VTLRLAAALALATGLLMLFTYLELMGRGPFASTPSRQLRAMKDRATAPATVTPFTLDSMAALPHGAPLAVVAAIERRGVVMEGYIQRAMRAVDDDIHLEIASTPRHATGADTVYTTAEITPVWRRGTSRWDYEPLVAAFHPNHGGPEPWSGGPRRARISGWLLYDYQYDAPPSEYTRAHGAPRISGWEIHPVTRIELWDDSLRRYVELAR
jgi:hypothetical protein